MGNAATVLSPAAQVVSGISQHLTTTCNSGNVYSSVIDGVNLSVSNVSCPNISLLTQSVATDVSCVNKSVTNAVSSALTARLHALAHQSKQTEHISLFGSTFSSVEKNLAVHISTRITEGCGNDNVYTNSIRDVSVDLEGIRCKELNVLRQQTSVQCYCAMKVFQSTLNNNAKLKTALPADTPPSVVVPDYVYYIAGAVLAIILVCVATYVVKSHQHVKQLIIQMGNNNTPNTSTGDGHAALTISASS